MKFLSFLISTFIVYNCARAKGICPEHQIWTNCGSCTIPSCSDIFHTGEPSSMCAAVCVEKCVCENGYLMDDINGRGCIPSDDCSETIRCKNGRIFKEKKDSCAKYCWDRNPPCTESKKGCYCPEDHFEDIYANCVLEGDCPLQ